MKEENLKTTRKRYSRLKFSKIPNYFDTVLDTNISNDYLYKVRILPYEVKKIEKYYKNNTNNVEYKIDSNNLHIYFNKKKDTEDFINNFRGNNKVPLYVLLRSLLYSADILDINNHIDRIIILSSTERYIQNYKTSKYKGVYNTTLMLFKMISVYKLHCYCYYKLTKDSLVISLKHSPYSSMKYND